MSHSHKEDGQLQLIRKNIESGKMQKVQAETRISSLQDQYKRNAANLKELGIDPKNAKDTIAQLEDEIAKDMKEIEALLPAK
jgi:chromosome segregation ATPase